VDFGIEKPAIDILLSKRLDLLSQIYLPVNRVQFPTQAFQRKYYYAAFVLFLLALLSKTTTATLPVILLIIVWWKEGELNRKHIWPLLPFFVLGIASGLFTAWVERNYAGMGGVHWDFSFLERCLIAGWALLFYPAKLLSPTHLSFTYTRWSINPSELFQYVYSLIVGLIFFAVLFSSWRWKRNILAGLLFYGATIFPALGFFDIETMQYSFVADHYQYLACAGLLCLLASALNSVLNFQKQRKALHLFIVVLIISLCIVLTFQQSQIYKDCITLYTDVIENNPTSWMAFNNRGYTWM